MTKEEKNNAIESIKMGTQQLVALVPVKDMQQANAAWDLIDTAVKALREQP